ncbi:MAG: excinuclease ABC subunit UvrA [Rikenellaceae bacterium]
MGLPEKQQYIHIKGARVHNLKNIDLDIPHNKLVVVTGLSGSGKSTLAFDTIFAEGRRRYVESLSAYARQFLGRVAKPDVDLISGIAPAIAIEQKVSSRNPHSTVGTSTEIYDYLKLMYARIGRTYSPISGNQVMCHTSSDVVDYMMSMSDGDRVLVCAPMKLHERQGVIDKLSLLMGEGTQRVVFDNKVYLIDELIATIAPDASASSIFIVIDRIKVEHSEDMRSRMGDSVNQAFTLGDGECIIFQDKRTEVAEPREFNSRFELDGMLFEHPSEHSFSFNNPIGACPICKGTGKTVGIDEDLVVPDKSKSLYSDAIACWRGESMRVWKERVINTAMLSNFPIHKPYFDLSKKEKDMLWKGCAHFNGLNDFFAFVEKERYKIQYRIMLARYTGKTICYECDGARLRKQSLYVKVMGKNISELTTMTVKELKHFFDNIELAEHEAIIAKRLIKEIVMRLEYLSEVGLDYLTIDRLSSTLSGGESQRINLATSLSSNLIGSMYILDEPSIGLHPRDTNRLISVLKKLRDLGNTIIVVEHEEEIIRAADWVIDIGPEAGYNGGQVVYNGTFDNMIKTANTLTTKYLRGELEVAPKHTPRKWNSYIEICGARENNLKGIDVRFPLDVMTCITGVSGSGKSSLVKDILYPAIRRELYETGVKPGSFESMGGDWKRLTAIEMIDQNPIGKSSRSNPVTYIKAYDDIRKLFSEQPYAKHNNMTPSHFSFNSVGGRCEHCQGEGVIKIQMQFMADVELVCEECKGQRFKDEVLEVKYKDNNIFDILNMTVDDACKFFESSSTTKKIADKLRVLQDVGLGYIRLGQSSSTLSGGESQRIKLAYFLLRENSSEKIMFIFDEPTTGLHFHDINKLLSAFNALIAKGHTIIVVEHNLSVIAASDWVIDLGPEAGTMGGNMVAATTPSELVNVKDSWTGKFLAENGI